MSIVKNAQALLLVGVNDALTPNENIYYKNYFNSSTQTGSTKEEQKTINDNLKNTQEELNDLQQKERDLIVNLANNAKASNFKNLSLRIPIPLELLNSQVQTFNTSMNKTLNRFNDVITINQNNNNVDLNLILSTIRNSAFKNLSVDILQALSDYYFNNNSKYLAVSYFSNDVFILNGYLISFNRGNNPRDTTQTISMTIEKDYSFIYDYSILDQDKPNITQTTKQQVLQVGEVWGT